MADKPIPADDLPVWTPTAQAGKPIPDDDLPVWPPTAQAGKPIPDDDLPVWPPTAQAGKPTAMARSSFLSNAVKPLANLPGDIYREAKEGYKQTREGLEGVYSDLTLAPRDAPPSTIAGSRTAGAVADAILGKGWQQPGQGNLVADVGRTALGVAQTLGSPFSGAAKALVGDPARNVIPQTTVAGRMAATTVEDLAGMMFGAGAPMFRAAAVSESQKLSEAAAGAIKKRLKQDGMTAEGALNAVREGNQLGVPVSLLDVGGSETEGLAGRLARKPGEPRSIASTFLEGRDATAPSRLLSSVSENFGDGSVKRAVESVATARSAAAAPLYERAFQGGSMAPLETQFTNEWRLAGKQVAEATDEISQLLARQTAAKARATTAGNVYSDSAAKQELREVDAEMSAAQKKLQIAQQHKQMTLDRMRQAQSDASSNAPGAVWSPRIQNILELPIARSGLKKGIELARNDSAATGAPFNLREYAITGFDEAGQPIVGTVPNMRMLASVKQGLDAMLENEALRDPLTGRLTQEGRSVDGVRRALRQELVAINPAYEEALAAWSGPSAVISATRVGKNVFRWSPETISDAVGEMGPAEREMAKLAVGETIRERILKSGFDSNEARAVAKSPWMQQQMKPFFDTQEGYDKFIRSLDLENIMVRKKYKAMGGSQTAGRGAEDFAAKSGEIEEAMHIGKNAATGRYLTSAIQAYRFIRDRATRPDPELDAAIARLVFDPGVTAEGLNPTRLPAPPRQPSVAGATLGLAGAADEQ